MAKNEATTAPATASAPPADADLIALKASMFDDAEAKAKSLETALAAATKRADDAEAKAQESGAKLAEAHKRANDQAKLASDARLALDAETQRRIEELTAASSELDVLRTKVRGLEETLVRREAAAAAAATGLRKSETGRCFALTNIKGDGQIYNGPRNGQSGEEIPEHIAAQLQAGVHFERR